MPEYNATSASQITTFLMCEARWGFGSLLKLPQAQGEYAAAGEALHHQREDYQTNGVIPAHPSVVASMDYTPPPKTEGIVVESWLSDFYLAGVKVRGRVDLTDERNRKSPLIIDWKSKGNFKGIKKKEALVTDIQLNIYGAELLQRIPEAESVSYAHGYLLRGTFIETEDGGYWTNVGFKPVQTDPITRSDVLARVKEIEPIIERMKISAQKPEAEWARSDGTNGTKRECFAFGETCPFYVRCKGDPMERLNELPEEEFEEVTSAVEKGEVQMAVTAVDPIAAKMLALRNKRAAQPDGAVGITPPDAPRYPTTK